MTGLCKVPGCTGEALFPLAMYIDDGLAREIGLCQDHFAWFVRGREQGYDMRPLMNQLFLLEYEGAI